MLSIQEKSFLITALTKGKLELQGRFINSSNFTFLALIQYQKLTYNVVYKPKRGERPLWDFPAGTLAKRETAAFLVSEMLGWDLVPPTCYRRRLPAGPGSVQFFIPHDPESHYFNMTNADKQKLAPMVLFDFLVNNADRKGGHIFQDENKKIWGIDHGLCFHTEDKLRSVIWDFAGMAIPPNFLEDVKKLKTGLHENEDFIQQISKLLQPPEIEMLEIRSGQILLNARFPEPANDRRPYPWPPI